MKHRLLLVMVAALVLVLQSGCTRVNDWPGTGAERAGDGNTLRARILTTQVDR